MANERGGDMAKINQLARYILDNLGSMTTMKLQKLCYYCQAWSMAWEEIPLIEENFEAWANGPVCPELYYLHKGQYVVFPTDIKADYAGAFNDDQIETINKVLDYYGDKEPYWLSELTHKEYPWKHAREGYEPGQRCSVVISTEDMQSYYGSL